MIEGTPVPLEPAELERVAELERLAARAAELAAGTVAPSTRRKYAAAWSAWSAWCGVQGFAELPADPRAVALYLADLVDQGRAASTLQVHASAIARRHRSAGELPPTASPLVGQVLAGARRELGTRGTPKRAISPAELAAMVRAVAGDRPRDVRDRAILLFGWASAMRRAELAALELADLELEGPGLVVAVRRSKSDQEGRGELLAVPYCPARELCPVRAVLAWRRVRQVEGLALFGISARTIARRVQRAAELAGLDAGAYGGHSLRSGFATAAAAGDARDRSIMHQTRHRSRTALDRYVRRGNLWRDPAAARALELLARQEHAHKPSGDT